MATCRNRTGSVDLIQPRATHLFHARRSGHGDRTASRPPTSGPAFRHWLGSHRAIPYGCARVRVPIHADAAVSHVTKYPTSEYAVAAIATAQTSSRSMLIHRRALQVAH